MALSPNYGWSEPDNSNLVKNGAADIRTLGDAIDTSVWNVGFGQAAKNKIINGDFNINQRAFTSNTTNGLFNFDRWFQSNIGGTFTVTPQTFTLGAAPVAGYEGKNFLQGITATQSAAADYAWFGQKIESVRTLAGQTATISFWAKAGSGTPKIAVEFQQFFGSGGSPSASVNTYAGQVMLSTSWARYSVSVAVPSISGKTLGTANDDHLRLNLMVSAGTDYNARSGSLGVQNNTFQIWGVQVEYGSKATPFQTSTGTIQGELAAAQRYYYRQGGDAIFSRFGQGYATSTVNVSVTLNQPTTMRVAPTAVDFSTLTVGDGATAQTVTGLTIDQAGKNVTSLNAAVASGLTQFRPYGCGANNSTSAFIGLSAEL